MPSPIDNPPLAVIGLRTAQEIPEHIATAVDALLPILSQQPRDVGSAAASFPVRALAEIAECAVRVIQGFAPDASKKPKEAQECQKVWAIIACVVVVVVAVIVAVIATGVIVFTFGTGTLMGAAIGGVIFPLNAANSVLVDFLNVAVCRGHPLAGELAAIMSQVMTALRNFVNASLNESMTARDKALKEIVLALGRLEGLIPAVHKIKGQWQGDPKPAVQSCRALTLILTRLTESLRFAHSIPSSEVQAVVRALSTLRQTLAEALPAKPHTLM